MCRGRTSGISLRSRGRRGPRPGRGTLTSCGGCGARCGNPPTHRRGRTTNSAHADRTYARHNEAKNLQSRRDAPGRAGCSPRERRWSGGTPHVLPEPRVLSARAEVVRGPTAGRRARGGALRASGGGPRCRLPRPLTQPCSPRERRRYELEGQMIQHDNMLPAQADMVRQRRPDSLKTTSPPKPSPTHMTLRHASARPRPSTPHSKGITKPL